MGKLLGLVLSLIGAGAIALIYKEIVEESEFEEPEEWKDLIPEEKEQRYMNMYLAEGLKKDFLDL